MHPVLELIRLFGRNSFKRMKPTESGAVDLGFFVSGVESGILGFTPRRRWMPLESWSGSGQLAFECLRHLQRAKHSYSTIRISLRSSTRKTDFKSWPRLST